MKEILEEWQETIESSEHEINKILELFNTNDFDLANKFEHVLSKYTEMVADKIGCSFDCLSWYRFDNNFGKSELSAGLNGNIKSIKNIDDLVELINLHKGTEKCTK